MEKEEENDVLLHLLQFVGINFLSGEINQTNLRIFDANQLVHAY